MLNDRRSNVAKSAIRPRKMAGPPHVAGEYLKCVTDLMLRLGDRHMGQINVVHRVSANFVPHPGQQLNIIPGHKFNWRPVEATGAERFDLLTIGLPNDRRAHEETRPNAKFLQNARRVRAVFETIIHTEHDIRRVDGANPQASHRFGIAEELIVQRELTKQTTKIRFLIRENVVQV